jgi:hypothetical protein
MQQRHRHTASSGMLQAAAAALPGSQARLDGHTYQWQQYYGYASPAICLFRMHG